MGREGDNNVYLLIDKHIRRYHCLRYSVIYCRIVCELLQNMTLNHVWLSIIELQFFLYSSEPFIIPFIHYSCFPWIIILSVSFLSPSNVTTFLVSDLILTITISQRSPLRLGNWWTLRCKKILWGRSDVLSLCHCLFPSLCPRGCESYLVLYPPTLAIVLAIALFS